jgi:hypothetical protein
MENELLKEDLKRINERLDKIEKELIQQKLILDTIYSFFNFQALKKNGLTFTGIYIAFILGNISGFFFIYNLIKWILLMIKK